MKSNTGSLWGRLTVSCATFRWSKLIKPSLILMWEGRKLLQKILQVTRWRGISTRKRARICNNK
jgi:hypothetical protein